MPAPTLPPPDSAPLDPIPSPLPDPTLAAPQSVSHLFWAFTGLALQGFGGVLAVVQRELVEKRRWLSPAGFVEDWSVAQVLPGPNIINLALMFGDRHFGLRGALAAMLGLLSAPALLLIALVLAYSHVQDLPAVQGALRGMAAVASGLIVATALKLVVALRRNALGPPLAGLVATLSFAAIALARVPLPWVLIGIGLPACLFAAWKLKSA